MLYIFSADENLLAILNNSGDSCPYFDAVHEEGLDGTNKFTFSIPANHKDAAYIVEGNLVAFRDIDSNYQLFAINRVIDSHGDKILRLVECENIAIPELIDIYIDDMRPANKTAAEALTQVLTGTRWQPGTVDNLGTNSTNYYHTNAMSAIQKIASVWGGEIAFRVSISANAVAGRYVDILARRGSDTGKRFVYSKDITEITRTVDLSSTKTALYGYGKGEETADGYGRRIDFADVVWTTPTDPANKPLGQKWVGDEDARLAWGHADGAGGRLHRFGVFEDSEETDPAILLQKTWDSLQKLKEPVVNYSMSVIDLGTLADLPHEAVRLGDGVFVIDSVLSPELRTQARVIKIARNILEPQETKVELGNFLGNLSKTTEKLTNLDSTINFQKGMWDDKYSAISGVPTSVLAGAINTLTNEIQSVNGYVRITDADGIIIYDTPDPLTATKALRLKGGIFAIANSKTGGNWNWSTFGTGDGFTADRITAGTMLADRILGGTLTLGGLNNTSGVATVKDAAGATIITLDQAGITINNNSLTISNPYTDLRLYGDANNNSVVHGSITLDLRGDGGVAMRSGDGATTYFYATSAEIDIYGGYYGTTIYSTGNDPLHLEAPPLGTAAGDINRFLQFHDFVANDDYLLFDHHRNTAGSSWDYSGWRIMRFVDANAMCYIYFDDWDNIDIGANTTILGNFTATGTKNAVVTTQSYGDRLTYADESATVKFRDDGHAQLRGGKARVELDPIFCECCDLNPPDYRIFLMPYGEYSLRVAEKTPSYFVVEEIGGKSNAEFDWEIKATRKGYRNVRLEQIDITAKTEREETWKQELIKNPPKSRPTRAK